MGQPEGGSADFAAGVATATAAQASQDADEAQEAAEAAEGTASAAVSIAASAEETAWDARAAVNDLDYRITERLDEIAARLENIPADKPSDDGAPPAPERREEPKEEPKPKEQKESSEAGYGSKKWFG